jgi:hypothetical protein
MDYNSAPQENKKEQFLYKMKLKSAIYVFILFLLLSDNKTYMILNLILPSFDIINDKNELFLSRFICLHTISEL